MPPKRPTNIFEVMNSNIAVVSEDLHALMSRVETMSREVNELRAMFNAPEQPNALGGEGAVE